MPEYGLNIGSRRSVNVITPTFDRDFATFGTLNHGIGPNITFTRASSATVFTSTGILSTVPNDVPRFEWGNFRTNLLSYSENLTLGWFVNPATTKLTPVVETGPFNSFITTFYLTGDGSSAGECFSLPINGQFQPYLTFSFFAKQRPGAPNDLLGFQFWQNTNSPFLYNTGSHIFSLTGNNLNSTYVTNITRTSFPNNWQRFTCLLSANPGNGLGVFYPTSRIDLETNPTNLFSNYVWGLQVEPGLSATNYIPTTNAPVTTGVPLGLLIEESRTNFVPTNNVFNWFYNAGNVSVSAGSGFAGLSSYIISDITESVRESAMFDFLSPLLTATPYTVSCYIRKDLTANNFNPLIRVRDTNDNYFGTSFNEALGTWQISQSGPNSGLTFITNVSTVDLNTHFRHWFTFSTPTTARPYQMQIFGAHGATPALTGSIEVAGIQVEQGSFPTSYIPTAGLSATRAADSAIVTPINSFYNQEQGTMFVEIIRPQVVKYSSFFGFNNGGGNEQYLLESGFADPTLHRFQVIDNGVAQAQIGNYSGSFINTVYRLAGAYAVDNFGVSQNGISPSLDSRGTLPTVTQAVFSVTPSQTYIRKVTYWPTRLSNNRLRTLTLSA